MPIQPASPVPSPDVAASAGARPQSRLESIDVLRGVIMILMALDHTRDFLGRPGIDPTNLAQAGPAMMLTRWITHFCAPVFSLLTGVGAYLMSQRRTRGEMSRFLLTRGAWLIVLELVVSRALGWQWNLDFRLTGLLVLWALGWSMIVLAGLIRLPLRWILAIGLGMILGHNLLDFVPLAKLGLCGQIVAFLHRPMVLSLDAEHSILSGYPLIPWIGVMATGYGLGQVFLWDAERRRRFLLRLGLGAIVAFVALRAINVYGDPRPWSPQASPVLTLLSFLNTTKYPPSLLFLLMTLGPAMLFLCAVDRATPRLLRPAVVYGRVPMFYYLAHVSILHLLALAVCYAQNGAVHWMFESPRADLFPITPPPGWGFGLPGVYAFWALTVAVLYPLCRWFGELKRRRRDPWLSYL